MADMFCIFSWGTDSYTHPFDAWAGLGIFFNVLSTVEQNIVALLVELCLMGRLNSYPITYLSQEPKESGEFERLFSLNLKNPNGSPISITQAKPESESSFLCATSDGMLWSLGECTPEGEWIADNIWQTKAETPKTPGTNSESDSCMESWPEPRQLKARQGKKIHLGPVTALHVLPGLLLTASKDRDVKLWARPSMQLLGLFRCDGPVSCLEPCLGPNSTLQLAVGDTQGNLYFLSWERECSSQDKGDITCTG